jgi:hypothetical protein
MEGIAQWKWTALELYLFADNSVAGHHLGAAHAKNLRENVLVWFHVCCSALRTAANYV